MNVEAELKQLQALNLERLTPSGLKKVHRRMMVLLKCLEKNRAEQLRLKATLERQMRQLHELGALDEFKELKELLELLEQNESNELRALNELKEWNKRAAESDDP